MAKYEWQAYCSRKKLEDDNDLQKLVNKDNIGGDQAAMDKALNKDGSQDFNVYDKFIESRQDYLKYAGYCPDSSEFSFKGQTYSIQFGFICQIGKFIRLMLHLFAYLAVIKMFAGLGGSFA